MTNTKLALLAALALFLSACGGSSDSGGTPPTTNAPTNLTAAGKLTGFGSIYVNGIEFETNGASYDIDDQQLVGDDNLSVGMYVAVKGSVNADGVSGTAESVSYDDEIEGPVAGIMPDPTDASRKIFFVFAVEIIIDAATVFEAEDGSAFGFDTIANDDNVEVSGEYLGDILLATYVEKQDAADDDYEVKGTVTAVADVDQFTLTLDNGSVLNVTVAAGAETPAGGIMVDQYVEVEGTIPDPVLTPDELLATKVEIEDEDYFDDMDDEVEIKGPLSYDMADDSWTINLTPIVFSESTSFEPESLADAIADGSADGRVVEVEGQYVDGALHADEVEDEEDDLELKAFVEEVRATDEKNGSIIVSFPGTSGGLGDNGQLEVFVDGGTFYMDDDAVIPFDLRTTLTQGMIIEVHARMDAAGQIVASALEIEDGTEVEIEGPVDGIDATSITVLTIVFTVDPTTVFVNGTPVVGDYVSIDDNGADGTADIVEIDD